MQQIPGVADFSPVVGLELRDWWMRVPDVAGAVLEASIRSRSSVVDEAIGDSHSLRYLAKRVARWGMGDGWHARACVRKRTYAHAVERC